MVHVDFLALALHNPERRTVQDYLIQANVPADIEGGKEWRMDSHPAGTVVQSQEPVYVSDLMIDQRYPEAFSYMREDGIQSLCAIPLTTAVRTLGALVFASREKETYRESDVDFLAQAAKPIAVGCR